MKTPTYGSIIGFNPTGDLGPFTIYTAKNRKPVFYIKAPPTRPATARQRFVRRRMAEYAEAWTRLTQGERDLWELASKRARLKCSGYALWQWHRWNENQPAIATIQRQANLTLPLA